MTSLVKIVYEERDPRNDDQLCNRAIVGYEIGGNDMFVEIRRESDGRRFLINRKAIVKIETLREEICSE